MVRQRMVKPIRDYYNTRPKQDTKPSKKSNDISTKETTGSVSSKPSVALAATIEQNAESTAEPTPPPAILKSTILGINAITKALERSIQNLAAHPPPTAIILCKGDLIPSHLYTHLGPMISMLPGVLLFPLLKGSERRLSEALGLPAVGAVAIRSTEGSREAEDLVMLLKGMVEPMTASWLPEVKLKPSTKDKAPKQPTEVAKLPGSTDTIESGSASTVASVTATAPGPASGAPIDTSSKTTANQTEFIPTNIKTIKTTMPIVVKTPKVTPDSAASNSNKVKGQKQQQQQSNQQQQQKQQNKRQSQNQNQNQNQKQKQNQANNQGKNKKPPVDNLDSDRAQGKKARSN
ncbi:hypothetical protein EC991_005365 [Linnemannia zychae]|nr:hypothetical protein EC991_005365 [Linnemannia zychae]